MITLTIVINGIPDNSLTEIWKDAIKEGIMTIGGFTLQPTDTITLDFKKISEDYPDNREILSDLIGSAVAGHLVMEVDKYLNQ